MTAPVSALDIPAGITAESGRAVASLLGADFRFAEPDWSPAASARNY